MLGGADPLRRITDPALRAQTGVDTG
jgi:hypothetical protein